MTTQTEALKLALEALTHGGCPPDCKDGMTDSGGVHPWGEAALIPCPNCQTITAIKEALAQPEQYPQIAINPEIVGYVAPQRTWVGLTHDEVNNFAAGCHLGKSVQGAIYEAEAKLKDKNTRRTHDKSM